MQNSLISFSTAFAIWLTLVGVFSYFVFKKTQIPQAALEIELSSFGEVMKQKNIAKKSLTKKLDVDKSSDLKKAEAKKSVHDHHFSDDIPKNLTKKIAPLFAPLPQIPDELRDEAFNSEAIARFYIAQDGTITKVELIKPCANPKLNNLLIKSLKKWQFAAGATSLTQDIRVNFLVK